MHKSAIFALVLAAGVAAPCFAQDAGVSGIRGVGSAGGLNNSVNDPSGAGNAARIPAPPPPSISVPTVPSAAPMSSSRVAPAVRSRGTIYSRTATVSRSESRRATRASARARATPVDGKFSICRGC